MIDFKKLDDTNIYRFEIKEKLQKESIEDIYKLLNQKAEAGEKIKLLGIIHKMPEFNVSDLGDFVKIKSKGMEVIEKYAVLSEANWLTTIIPAANLITPGTDVKHFELDEEEKALAWLAYNEVEKKEAQSNLSPTIIKQEAPNVYSFTLSSGKIDETVLTVLYQTLTNAAVNGKIRLLADVSQFNGFDELSTLFKGIKTDLAAIGHVEKFAMISKKEWLDKLLSAGDFLIPGIDMKAFQQDQRSQAIEWLKGNEN